MNFKSTLTCLILLPTLSWAQTQYTVQDGDTILKIADRNLGTTDRKDPRRYVFLNQIQKLNPQIKDLNLLIPGQKLIIPTPEKAQETAQVKDSTEGLKKITVDMTQAESTKAPEAEAKPATPEPLVEDFKPPQEKVNLAPLEAPHTHVKHAGNEHPNFFMIQPRYQMVKLESENLSTHDKSTLKSKSSYGLDLQYGKIINEKYHLLFNAGIAQTEFDDIQGYATSVNHKTETSKVFGVGLAYEAAHTVHLDLMVLYTDRTFLIPGAGRAYKLEQIALPALEFAISWDMYSGSAHIVGLTAMAEYIGNGVKDGVDYKSAVEPFGALYWKSNRGHDHVNYKATLTYKHGHQKTSVSEQKEELTALGIGFIF